MSTGAGAWVGDPGVVWTPALVLERPARLEVAALADRLAAVNRILLDQESETQVPVVSADLLLPTVTRAAAGPVTAAVDQTRLAVAVDHAYGDGLSLLAVVRELTGVPLVSDAGGVGERPPRHGFLQARVRRLGEALVRPPAAVPATRLGAGAPGDVFAHRVVAWPVRTSALVLACARAAEHLAGTRRPTTIAVGVSRRSGSEPALGDHSALLRLGPGETADAAAVRQALRSRGTEADARVGDGAGAGGGLLAAASRRAQGALASRLGSTLLVSHLGVVTGRADGLAFYPVTGGGSGTSVGAVVQGARTVLTARARAERHDAAGLGRVLDAVIGALPRSGR